jgi:hypothetical protein
MVGMWTAKPLKDMLKKVNRSFLKAPKVLPFKLTGFRFGPLWGGRGRCEVEEQGWPYCTTTIAILAS